MNLKSLKKIVRCNLIKNNTYSLNYQSDNKDSKKIFLIVLKVFKKKIN